MHGLVHQTLKRYVVEKTDEASWAAVRDRAGLEKKLYLPVTRYDDAEFDAALEALSAMSGHDRRAIERDLGRTLAAPLLQTFQVHVKRDRADDLVALLCGLEEITEALRGGGTRAAPPTLSGVRIGDGGVAEGNDGSVATTEGNDGGADERADGRPSPAVRVAYRSEREYCALARGILEGVAAVYDEPATVTETACVRDGADECAFEVALEDAA